jgi:3-deoxy-7-phosphoheptulonate synthase
VNQVRCGNLSIVGSMIESHLLAGKQAIPEDLSKLAYGVSVTDGCVGWDTTEEMILSAAEALRGVLQRRRGQRS